MLKKRERLTTAAFNQYFKTGRRLHSPTLQLIVAPHDGFHGAVVVGKKVYKQAVDRNRVRRQLYAALYQLRQSSTIESGVYIVIAKPPLAAVPARQRTAELRNLLKPS